MTCFQDCNNHGTCINNNCSCDIGYFSNSSKLKCSLKGSSEWGSGWIFFQIFFILMFSITFLISSQKLYKSLAQEKTSDCQNKAKRLILSPKNLSLLGIFLISALRVIWLSYDPLVFKDKSNRMLDRMLFEIIYPIIYTILSSVLLVWSGIYQRLKKKNKFVFKIVSKGIIVLMVLAYPFTLMVSINKGLRQEQKVWYWIGYISIAVGSFILSVSFITFSGLLFMFLRRERKNYSRFRKSKECKKSKGGRNGISLTQNCFEDNKFVDCEYCEKNDCSGKLEKLSKDDRKIVRKLLVITSCAGVSGMAIIGIGTPFAILDSIVHPLLTYSGLFFELFLELSIVLLIIFAFTRQVNSSEKKNFKQMLYFSRKNRSTNIKIALPDDYKEISHRLEIYYL